MTRPSAVHDDALFLLLQAAGQHHVGVVRGLGQEEVDDAEELQLLERLGRVKPASGRETSGLKQIESSALDLAAVDGLHDLHRGEPGLRDLLRRDAPDARHVLARRGIGDRALAGELVALLAVLAAALAVALAGDHDAARALAADVAGGQAQVDHGEAVLDALRLVLDAAGVQRHRAVGLARTSAPPSRWRRAARR